MFAFVNDEFVIAKNVAVPATDLAVNRGYGVFDFFKTIEGKPIFLDDHLSRFYRSAAQLRLAIPYEATALKSILFQLLEKNKLEHSGVRLTLTGGSSADGYSIGKPNLIISQQALLPLDIEIRARGIKLLTVEYQRQLPAVKTIDYLMPIWLQPLLQEQDADDFLYHQNGMLTECPRANVFIVTADDKLVTPHQNILEGITRKKVLEIAKRKYDVEERTVTMDEAIAAKEVFITSTTKGVLPVRMIDSHPIGSGNRETSSFLQEALHHLY